MLAVLIKNNPFGGEGGKDNCIRRYASMDLSSIKRKYISNKIFKRYMKGFCRLLFYNDYMAGVKYAADKFLVV